jgi:hypothetical protein
MYLDHRAHQKCEINILGTNFLKIKEDIFIFVQRQNIALMYKFWQSGWYWPTHSHPFFPPGVKKLIYYVTGKEKGHIVYLFLNPVTEND